MEMGEDVEPQEESEMSVQIADVTSVSEENETFDDTESTKKVPEDAKEDEVNESAEISDETNKESDRQGGESEEKSENESSAEKMDVQDENKADDENDQTDEKSSSESAEKSTDEKSPSENAEKSSDESKEKSNENEDQSDQPPSDAADDTEDKSSSDKADKSDKDKEVSTENDEKSDDKSPSDTDKDEPPKKPLITMMRWANDPDRESEPEENQSESEESADENEEKKTLDKDLHTEIQVKEDVDAEQKDKPKMGLKLASFASKQISPTKKESGSVGGGTRGACVHCDAAIISLKTAVVWEAMQFCKIDCLATYMGTLSRCSTCQTEVSSVLLGKYCVRFGADIKQFCSNPCLEDYKKGLKVCSYCQKDISGGDGFLAPVGNKGQFKDFCDQHCLNKYDVLNKLKEPEVETGPCKVCQKDTTISEYLIRPTETIKFCENSSCLSAYKFANKIESVVCANCKKGFDDKDIHFPIYCDGGVNLYCSQACQNVAIMLNRKIVPCSNCRVKKYNFDMIEVYEDSVSTTPNMYCSLHCRTLLKNTEKSKGGAVSSSATSQVPVISDIFSASSISASAPGPGESIPMPGLPKQPLPMSQLKASLPQPPPLQQMAGLPQVPPMPALPQLQPPPQIQVKTQTVTEVVKETKVLPAEVPKMANKNMQTKPFMVTKSISCRPAKDTKSCQTEGLSNPTIVPIPIPIHVPTPCAMYNAPYPVPVPIPLPFPVPVFIPTTRNSIKGILKQINKIKNKIPADPFEAELLALAGDIADQDKDSDDSDYDPAGGGGFDDDDLGSNTNWKQEQVTDLENEMHAERIVPKPLPISTPEPPPPRPYNFGYPNTKRGREDDDEDWRPENLFDQRAAQAKVDQRNQSQRRSRGRTGSTTSHHQIKRQRTDSVTPSPQQPSIPTQPKERPDVNHHLKFTYGVNAWKHWVVGKNAELEKQRAQGKYQKSFETDILKLRADELNFTLCMFVKEVKKPNGDSYAADSILYLVLGIQEYLFENGRIDNIFTDSYYDPFTSALHEVVKDFKLPVNELGYFVTRIEEEHLWESKQLGAHSPQVLLNTLVYFNTKFFQLKTPDEHLKLSFSHIMKHWKKTTVTKSGEQQRTVLLRYYPPPQKGQKNEDRKMYEQHESTDNPLRCPVKLYEFYLSKCPETTKNRNDMFYLQPERSCVPDSPVWYSQQLLNKFNMEKMLARLLMVREVQEHMLADQ